MSAFAEPLAQARENVDHAEALLTRDPFGEAERSLAATLLREALAAIERAETWAAEMERVLRELVDGVRILDVMLREPAAKGLMSADDYRSYLQGAWLGVDEKTAAARAVLPAREAATAVSENCPRGGTHARIAHPGGRCIKCGASAREEAQ